MGNYKKNGLEKTIEDESSSDELLSVEGGVDTDSDRVECIITTGAICYSKI